MAYIIQNTVCSICFFVFGTYVIIVKHKIQTIAHTEDLL
jgi:hypothetical protein